MNYKCLETGIRDNTWVLVLVGCWKQFVFDTGKEECFMIHTATVWWYDCSQAWHILLDAVRVTKFSERHKFDATHYIIVSISLLLHLIFFNKVLCGNEVEGVHRLGTLAHRNPEFRSISDNGWALNSLCRYWPCDGMLPHPQTSVQCVTERESSSPLTKTAEDKIKYSWKINRRKKQR